RPGLVAGRRGRGDRGRRAAGLTAGEGQAAGSGARSTTTESSSPAWVEKASMRPAARTSSASSASRARRSGVSVTTAAVTSVRIERLASLFARRTSASTAARSEEHTSELQSRENLVCRLLLEKKKRQYQWR